MTQEHFALLVMGTSGGPVEDSLTGYLLGPASLSHFIALDAGCLLSGIEKCIEKNPNLFSFSDPTLMPVKEFLQKKIKSYFISHPHLDHILALVIASQIDSKKTIYGISYTLDVLQEHIFNEHVWPNYISDKSKAIYKTRPLEPKIATVLPEVQMEATVFLLNHNIPYFSSACFFEYARKVILYFGDTFSDLYAKDKRLEPIWQKAAAYLREKKLLAILLECSYSAEIESAHMYGHLNVTSMIYELTQLGKLADLSGLKVIVNHRKNSLDKFFDVTLIEKQLRSSSLPVEWIFPEKGDYIRI